MVAGHKKDVVISSRLTNSPGKVAIYGWHQTNGKPIQPLYLGHVSTWVDYSQCVRLVQEEVIINGRVTTLSKALADPALAGLFSSEGPVLTPRYQTNLAAVERTAHDKKLADWLSSRQDHYLSVLAYDDASALLEGKTFVSAKGGTWGRCHWLSLRFLVWYRQWQY